MKIKTIISQHRRDFQAVFECEHCGHEETKAGYDDGHYHGTVVPGMKCLLCDKIAPTSFRPLATRHGDGVVV